MASLEAQKDHYESYIKANPDWEFAGIYYDEYTPYGQNPKSP
jgi:site-specific DNA recombinase